MIHTPAHHQTDAAQRPGQIIDGVRARDARPIVTLADYVRRVADAEAQADAPATPAPSTEALLANLVQAVDMHRRALRALLIPDNRPAHLQGATVRLNQALAAAAAVCKPVPALSQWY